MIFPPRIRCHLPINSLLEIIQFMSDIIRPMPGIMGDDGADLGIKGTSCVVHDPIAISEYNGTSWVPIVMPNEGVLAITNNILDQRSNDATDIQELPPHPGAFRRDRYRSKTSLLEEIAMDPRNP